MTKPGPRARAGGAAPERAAARRLAARWVRAVAVLPALLGCDIVQGFQDAGTALFPEQSTHLSTPALRLVSGGYRSISLAAGRELNILARSADGGSSLFVMRFANPKPCEIPDVGRYVTSRSEKRAEAIIAYFHEDAAQGTLHFADTSCKTFELELDDARLPLGETDDSAILWAGDEVLEIAPETGSKTQLSADVSGVITRAFSGRTLVRSSDRLEVLGSDWKSQGLFGRGVSTVIKTKNGALYLDDTGLRRLSATSDGKGTQDELVMADACHLSMRDQTWATFNSPCDEGRLQALREPSGELYELGLDADPRYLRLIAARGSPGKDPTVDPFWFFFLRDVSGSAGTLVLRDPSGVEHVVGENATFDQFKWLESDDESHGYALVDVDGRVGSYVHFDGGGASERLAENVLARADRLIVDFDGSTGKLAAVSGDRLAIIAERIPDSSFEFTDESNEWTVIFHDWQGDSGRLSRFAGTLDALAKTPIDAPFAPPELEQIAPSVGAFTTSSLGQLLPGTVFLADYDARTNTGRLTYENAELRFKATVDAGVSDYLITSDDLLYSIPYGEQRGIWLATGK